MDSRLQEQDLYELLKRYRTELKTSALTTYDIPKFINKNQSCKPAKVLKYLVLGNACSWGSYEVACSHYEKYHYSIDNLIEGSQRGSFQKHTWGSRKTRREGFDRWFDIFGAILEVVLLGVILANIRQGKRVLFWYQMLECANTTRLLLRLMDLRQ